MRLSERLSFKFMVSTTIIILLVMSVSLAWDLRRQKVQARSELTERTALVAQQFLAARDFIAQNEALINRETRVHFDENLNPGSVGRGIGELFGVQTHYRFKQIWLKNENEKPDSFETEALRKFSENPNLPNYSAVEVRDGKKVFRFMVPVYMEKPCLGCHGREEESLQVLGREGTYELGDLAGGLSIVVPMDTFEANLRSQAYARLISTLVLIVMIIASIYLLMNKLVAVPLSRLKVFTARLGAGDLGVRIQGVEATGEIRQLADEFTSMAARLRDLYADLERKVAERTRELREANEKLQRQQEQLIRVNKELEHANQLKSQFLASVSHELRTPLTAILALAELLLEGSEGELNPDQKRDLQDILDSGQQLLGLINDLLDFAKIEAGKMELKLGEVDMKEVVRGAEKRARPVAAQKGLGLHVEVEQGLPSIYADPKKVEAVVLNLISNAIKFTPVGGQVRVAARRAPSEKGILISVADTGIGIDRENQGLIFEKFYQINGSNARGTGLGLALAKELVVLHGGEISVESELGKGSTFTVFLPLRGPGATGVEKATETKITGGSQDGAN